MDNGRHILKVGNNSFKYFHSYLGDLPRLHFKPSEEFVKKTMKQTPDSIKNVTHNITNLLIRFIIFKTISTHMKSSWTTAEFDYSSFFIVFSTVSHCYGLHYVVFLTYFLFLPFLWNRVLQFEKAAKLHTVWNALDLRWFHWYAAIQIYQNSSLM